MVLFLVCLVAFGLLGLPVGAQVVVVVPRSIPEDPHSAVLAEQIADSLQLTLQLTDRHDVRARPTARTAPPDETGAAALAEAEELRHVIFGEVARGPEDAFRVELSLYSHEAGRVIRSREAVIPSGVAPPTVSTEGRAATDRLLADFLLAFTGSEIPWGRLEVVNRAAPPGEYLVLVDGYPAGQGVSRLDRIPAGERLVEIVALEGPRTGETILSRRVAVSTRAVERLTFSLEATEPVDMPRVAREPEPRREPSPEPGPEDDRPPDPPPGRERPDPRGSAIGFRLGYSFPWMSGDGYYDAIGDDSPWAVPEGRLSASVLYEFGNFDVITIELEVAGVRLGGEAEVSEQMIGNISYFIDIWALTFATYLKPRFPVDTSTLFLVVGPQLTWLISDLEVEMESDFFSDTFSDEPDERFLLGFSLGTGIELPLGDRGLVGLDAMYTRTLTSFYDDGDWYLNNLSFGLGYRHRF